MGFDQFALLKHVIRQKDPSRCKQTYHIWKPVNILSLGCVHKNQIISSQKCRKDLTCISCQKSDPVFLSGFAEIFSCDGNSLFIVFYRCDMHIRLSVLTHKKCGEANGCPHLQNLHRPFDRKQYLHETLHFFTYDRDFILQGKTFQFFKKWCIARIERIDICTHSLLYDHEVTPSCSASPARIPMILFGV